MQTQFDVGLSPMLPVNFLFSGNGHRSPVARVAARERFAMCANNRWITGEDQADYQATKQVKNRRDNRRLAREFPRNGWQFRGDAFFRCAHCACERLTMGSASSINAAPAFSIFPTPEDFSPCI